mgnify:CR=1 FL=1
MTVLFLGRLQFISFFLFYMGRGEEHICTYQYMQYYFCVSFGWFSCTILLYNTRLHIDINASINKLCSLKILQDLRQPSIWFLLEFIQQMAQTLKPLAMQLNDSHAMMLVCLSLKKAVEHLGWDSGFKIFHISMLLLFVEMYAFSCLDWGSGYFVAFQSWNK